MSWGDHRPHRRRGGPCRPGRPAPARRLRLAAAAMLLLVAGPNVAGETGPEPAADQLGLRFALLDNQHEGGAEFLAELTVTHRGAAPLPGGGWRLYFNFGRPLRAASAAAGVDAGRVNGDLWRLTPNDRFAPLAPGEERRIRLAGRGAVTRRSDAPAGFYLVTADGRAAAVRDYVVAPFPGGERLRRAAADRVPVATPEVLFERNRGLEPLPAEGVGRIVPTPRRLEPGAGRLTLGPGWRVRHPPELALQAARLTEALAPHLGAPGGGAARAGAIVLRLEPPSGGEKAGAAPRPPAGAEAYRLTVDAETGIEIVGADPAGVFYGIQSLRALLPPEPAAGGTLTLPELRVEDAPRFPYRGLHLDVARNFHRRETVEKLLELAAFYKLNRFHFHLTDDEGWRLPVAALPELTAVGGRRGHTDDETDRLIPSFGSGPDPDPAASHGSGSYTRQEMVAILRRAGELQIRVIPEIDVPGHARAAIRSMAARHARLAAAGRHEEAAEFLLDHPGDTSEYRSVQGWDDNVVDVCLPSTYRFLGTVFDEIAGIWAEAGAPLKAIHVGGDEVPAGAWRGSPACRRLIREDPELHDPADLPAYFLRRVADLLAERGLATAGWEEIALAAAGAADDAKRPNPEFLERGFLPYVWNNVWGWGGEDLGYRLANLGYQVVLANATNLYFDLAYDKHPEEPGYAWAGFVDTRKPWELVPLDLYKSARADLMGKPIDAATAYADSARLTAAGRARVRGIQGQLWAENSKGRAMLEYQAFPKLLGLAERAWAAQPGWARVDDPARRNRLEAAAWNEFANRLGQRELPRLDRLAGGVLYRLPPPGAMVRGGMLEANAAFPGLAIRYTTDGSEPSAASTPYAGPVAVEGVVRLKTFDSRGRGSRTSVVEAGAPPGR